MSQEKLKEALVKTIEAIKNNPSNANAVFRANTQLIEGVRCDIKVRDFSPLVVDEPPSLGGTDRGMNPVELVLGALGTCQEIMYAAFAAVMGIKLDKVTVNVTGNLNLKGLFGMDESVPAGFNRIRYETKIESPADSKSLGTLVQTVESHCPVLDTLTRAVEVKGEVSINGTKLS